MRTTIDLPDTLYRKTKAIAALQGSSMKDLIVEAIELRVTQPAARKKVYGHRVKLPLIRDWKGPKLDLTNFDFDDLLD
jgi:hypothetical protein